MLYVGCSTDFENRLREHDSGTACRTTLIDPPAALIFVEIATDFPAARKRELQIKRWTRAKKLALAHGNLAALRRLSSSRQP